MESVSQPNPTRRYLLFHFCSRCHLTGRLIWSSLFVAVMAIGTLIEARPQRNLQHIAVVENAAWEQTLPQQFQNPFYKTPRVRDALARSSWFGPGEEVVGLLVVFINYLKTKTLKKLPILWDNMSYA